MMRVRVLFVASLMMGAVATQAQQPATTTAPSMSPTYQWHGELVSIDQNAKTITVRAHVLDTSAKEVQAFKSGDRVLLHWSGYDSSASSIRGVRKYDATAAGKDSFLMPVQLASPEVKDSYVTFTLRVPDSVPAALTPLKPGEWITVTSKQRPSGDDVVVSARPYVMSNPGA